MQTLRKKIDLGQCSNRAHVKVASIRQPQAQPTRTPQANIPQQLAHQGKRPIMQAQPRKQARPVQQRRRNEPMQP